MKLEIVKKEKIRLFENEVVERMMRSYPIFQFTLWYSAAAYFLFQAFQDEKMTAFHILLIFGIAFLRWTLIEYSLHRWLYHLPLRGKMADRLRYIMHDHHHDNPHDHSRLLAPFVPMLVITIVDFFWHRSSYPDPGIFNANFGSFCLAYIFYETVHFAVHKYNFRSSIFKAYKRYHMIHHCSNEATNYGVTTMFWDRIFRTQYRRAETSQLHSVEPNPAPISIPVAANGGLVPSRNLVNLYLVPLNSESSQLKPISFKGS